MIAVIDIVGSTALARRIGDLAYAAMLEDFRASVRFVAASYKGHEFADTGDGFIHLYQAPVESLDATIAILNANERLNASRANGVVLRAGLHRGSLVRCKSGLVGLALNNACELGQNADAGELWLSTEAVTAMHGRCGATGTRLITMPKSGWNEIHYVEWMAHTHTNHPGAPPTSSRGKPVESAV